MNAKEILSRCDHTILRPSAVWSDIKTVLDDAVAFSAASACIPPYFVTAAKNYVGNKIPICTVIGFPNGYNTTLVKSAEALEALKAGADEIDMVINLCEFKAGNYAYVSNEIQVIKQLCGQKILKVIVETCLLTTEEKIKACELVTLSGADFIKTSTGFSSGGATLDDVKLLKEHVGRNVGVKASGGIRSLEDAEKFIAAGADRLGTSKIVELVKENMKK